MKNITITLDEHTAEWARAEAAAQGLSLSRYVGEVLRRQLPQALAYEQAMNRWFASQQRSLKPLRKPGEKLPTREEIYDRPVLRRR
ncbi:MAG: hypothetical protein QM696_04920 [Steroidobacteraceae bacterium]